MNSKFGKYSNLSLPMQCRRNFQGDREATPFPAECLGFGVLDLGQWNHFPSGAAGLAWIRRVVVYGVLLR